jgi:hypothetical protein
MTGLVSDPLGRTGIRREGVAEGYSIAHCWHADAAWDDCRSAQTSATSQQEFGFGFDECASGIFDLLEGLVQHMMGKDGVPLERVIDYAERCKELNPLEAWRTANAWRLGVAPVGN